MKKIEIKYFLPEDVAYITLSKNKSSIGDEEYQPDVILYRNDNELVGIEIQNFYSGKIDKIKVSDKDAIDFTIPFRVCRMFISLQDIMDTDKKQFEETLAAWNILPMEDKNMKKFFDTQKFDCNIPNEQKSR